MLHIEMNNPPLSLSLASTKSDAAQQTWQTQCLPPAPQAHTSFLWGDRSQSTAAFSQPTVTVA